jgi:biotin carboxylase
MTSNSLASDQNKLFYGKTLLMLGSNVGAPDMLQYAKDNGAVTIAVDYLSPDRSLCKQIADENYLISTADFDGLKQLCIDKHVDAILSGVSEFNIIKAMDLSACLGLPFWCTREQWDAVEDKGKFRKLCERYKVPTPETYFVGQPEDIDFDVIDYPCILKPVDGSGSSGITICRDESQLKSGIQSAVESSSAGRVIIEEYMAGDEVAAHFVVCNGKCRLACVDNRYPIAVGDGDVTTIPGARVFPSLFIDEFINQVSPSLEQLFEGVGLRNAVVFVQGNYDVSENRFGIFEAGLRSAGEAPNRFLEEVNGLDYMKLIVDSALGVASAYDPDLEDPTLHGKTCAIVSFVGKGGIVGEIQNLEETVNSIPAIRLYENRYKVGDLVPSGNTLRQLMTRFVMIEDSREALVEDVRLINKSIDIFDDAGEEIIIKINPDRFYSSK